MVKEQILAKLHQIGIVAVIRGPLSDLTISMVDALVAGGIVGIEITFSIPNAEEVAKQLSQKYGDDIVLGMGTLTKIEHVEKAKRAGARFLVSPICEAKLINAMMDTGIVTMAGAFTPTEIYTAYNLGVDVVKIFPASILGSSYIKLLRGPFPKIPLMPTGGVTINNLEEWFDAGVFGVGIGSELCSSTLALAGHFTKITENAIAFNDTFSRIKNRQ